MDLARGPWQATVFSGLMGLTNACESASARAAGVLAAALGYPAAFTIMALPSLVGLMILPLVPLVERERITGRAVAGALVAVAGSALLFAA